MHELKFLEVARFGDLQANLPHGLTPVKETFATYIENAKLAINLGALPGFYVLIAEKWIAANIQAHEEVTRSRIPVNDLERKRVNDRIGVIFGKSASTQGNELRLQMKERTETFEAFVRHGSPDVHAIVCGLLKAIVIQTWTAFEVLLGDLVKRLQITHPKVIPPGNFSFTTRLKFRASYQKAFNDSAINAILDHECIDATALLRNVLVHANGRADDRFLSVKENAYPVNKTLQKWFPALTMGDEVLLNGEIVREVTEPCLQQGSALAAAVDGWLKRRI